jgi:toxin ParE1/3/4
VKPAALRPLAETDLLERTAYYQNVGGPGLAEQFFDAAVASLRAIESGPALGSPRVGELIGVDGLRRIGVEGFPCGWFYLERTEMLDVVRLIADRQDLAGALGTTI